MRQRWWATGALVGAGIVGAVWGAWGTVREPVALELVLAVDVSSSVSHSEYLVQMDGISAAFRDEQVIAAIEGSPGGIAVTLIQWSGPLQQQHHFKWIRVDGRDAAEEVARRIGQRSRAFVGGSTAIAPAIDAAIRSIEANRFQGVRRVIDVSGDGPANQGTEPEAAAARAVGLGVTINGLAIENEVPALGLYYREHVAAGPGAFVIPTENFETFAEAMRRKLLAEILGAPSS